MEPGASRAVCGHTTDRSDREDSGVTSSCKGQADAGWRGAGDPAVGARAAEAGLYVSVQELDLRRVAGRLQANRSILSGAAEELVSDMVLVRSGKLHGAQRDRCRK